MSKEPLRKCLTPLNSGKLKPKPYYFYQIFKELAPTLFRLLEKTISHFVWPAPFPCQSQAGIGKEICRPVLRTNRQAKPSAMGFKPNSVVREVYTAIEWIAAVVVVVGFG